MKFKLNKKIIFIAILFAFIVIMCSFNLREGFGETEQSRKQSTPDKIEQSLGLISKELSEFNDNFKGEESGNLSQGNTLNDTINKETPSLYMKGDSSLPLHKNQPTGIPKSGNLSQGNTLNDTINKETPSLYTKGDSSLPLHKNQPTGIPKSQIPHGNEHLYILKSQIVPPVCPRCPDVQVCPKSEKKCPACPPCGRCPEPAFECKKVPNYNRKEGDYLPRPVLANFSQFGI